MHLSAASNLLDLQIPLHPVTLDDIFHRIRDEKSLAEDILRLRRVRQMDESAYKRLKVRLPFFCCGIFRDGLRRTGHFLAIHTFVLDLDKVSSDTTELAATRLRLTETDERIALAFASPGGDGLKLLFRLDRPCTDTKRFSDFYKAFSFEFAARHNLQQFIDTRTSDATRVCFLSHDPQAFINPMSDAVDWESYLPEHTQPELAGLFPSARPAQNEVSLPEDLPYTEAEHPNRSHQIRPDVYADILGKLKTRAKPNPVQREVFVPGALDLALPSLLSALEQQGILLLESRPIQYGRQLVLLCQQDKAELNLFYGKRGFSVVKVPRRINNESLADLCVHIVEQTLYSRQAWQRPASPDSDGQEQPDSTL